MQVVYWQGLVDFGLEFSDRLLARILLKADCSSLGPAWSDQQISEALDLGVITIHRVRRSFVEGGLDGALVRRPASRRPRMLDGEQEAHLIALACGSPPAGRCRWTLRFLADKLVELGHVGNVSHETIRRTLKKTRMANLTGEAQESTNFYGKSSHLLADFAMKQPITFRKLAYSS